MKKPRPAEYSNIRVKPMDILVIALAAAFTAFIGIKVYSGGYASSNVIIRGPDKTWVYPLNSEADIHVSGPLGETVVHIHEGRAEIVSSPCEGQTCVAAGAMTKNGQWAACLPNRVVVLIEGTDNENGVDAASW